MPERTSRGSRSGEIAAARGASRRAASTSASASAKAAGSSGDAARSASSAAESRARVGSGTASPRRARRRMRTGTSTVRTSVATPSTAHRHGGRRGNLGARGREADEGTPARRRARPASRGPRAGSAACGRRAYALASGSKNANGIAGISRDRGVDRGDGVCDRPATRLVLAIEPRTWNPARPSSRGAGTDPSAGSPSITSVRENGVPIDRGSDGVLGADLVATYRAAELGRAPVSGNGRTSHDGVAACRTTSSRAHRDLPEDGVLSIRCAHANRTVAPGFAACPARRAKRRGHRGMRGAARRPS